MNKLLFKIVNCCMPKGNYVNYQAEQLYNAITPVFEDPMDLSDWEILNIGNWGSARPDNICVGDASMVFIENGNYVSATQSYPQGITGKGWSGETSEVRYYMCGSMCSKYKVQIGQSVSVLATIDAFVGCCPAIWLFPSTRDEEEKEFYSKYYREIDLLESYPQNSSELNEVLQSWHFGTPEERYLVSKSFNKAGTYNQKLLFTVDLYEKKFIFKINGITTGIYYPCREEWNPKGMNLILSAAVTNSRKPYYNSDMVKQIPLGKLTTHGIKIKNL
jgi:hypothetical protein